MTTAHAVAKLDGIFAPDEALDFGQAGDEIMVRRGALSVGSSSIPFDVLLNDAGDRRFLATVLSAYVASPAYDRMWNHVGRHSIAAIPLSKSLLRSVDVRHVPAHVPFHQDVAFMMDDSPSMNCWVALDDCGPRFGLPSLEVLAAPIKSRLQIVPHEERQFRYHRNIELDLETLRDRYPAEAFWHPDFCRGDGVLFDQYTPHRTYIETGMQGSRRSMEIRLCPASAVPDEAPWTPKVEIRNENGIYTLVLVDGTGTTQLLSVVEKD